MEFEGILQFADRTLCPKIAFNVQCYSVLYYPTAYYSVYGVNLYTSLNRNYYLYLKVADLVIFFWHSLHSLFSAFVIRFLQIMICEPASHQIKLF